MQKSPKIFFGWWTVLACGIAGLLGTGVAHLGFSVLFKPLAEELALSRAVTSTASSITSVVAAVSGPIGGWSSDKYGPRRVMLLGVIILALGCIAMYFIDSLWSFLIVWGVFVGGGVSLGVTIITDRAIVNWFVKKSGVAINIKFAIQALSGLGLLPVIAWLVTTLGWRRTSAIEGIFIAVVTIPLIWFYVKPHRPEYYGLLPDGVTKKPERIQANDNSTNASVGTDIIEFTFRQSMKTSTYWLLIAIGYVSGLMMPMMGAHCIPFLTDREIDPVQAASMMGLMVTVGIPARLATGFIVDRLKTDRLRFLMAMGAFLQAIGTTIFLVSQSTAAIYAWFLLYGIGSGITQSVNLPLISRYFGRTSFGSITGVSHTLQLPVGLAAPVYIGWVYDTYGNYMNVIVLMAVLFAISGVITCFIRPPKSPTPKN